MPLTASQPIFALLFCVEAHRLLRPVRAREVNHGADVLMRRVADQLADCGHDPAVADLVVDGLEFGGDQLRRATDRYAAHAFDEKPEELSLYAAHAKAFIEARQADAARKAASVIHP